MPLPSPEISRRVRGVVSGLLSLFLVLAVLGAVARPGWAGTVREEHLASAVLGRDYPFLVYLPDPPRGAPGKQAGAPLPVLYLLHGANGDEHAWVDKGKMVATLDRLIAEKRIKPLIVVMPGHKGMWWVDGHGDKAETVLLKELLPEVERRFPVRSDRAGRAVAGLSAGGFATLRLAFKYPQLFAAGAALSPAIYAPEPPAGSSARKDPAFQKKNGRFDARLWQRLNWPSLLDAYRNQPLRVPLYINSGDRDRFDIAYHAAVFHHTVRPLQPEAIAFRVVDGDHEWPVWERTLGDALLFMDPYLGG
ncbi:alpha/beta hydrolase [Pararhodospirillum photometricum]|uniref:Putative esterase n=1 Tax=Pararhodospirillum photometricum DSM 122 TaxID=1150469 RepID=H6SND4_PARPM|nr:alpha/beta hydrolase-fold protein [Pararhodospirillum photometricum]CCG09265.1 Putative esterase [Pararhodospirillum photometricum DSM 122]